MKISLEPNFSRTNKNFETPELRIKLESIDDILIMMHIGNMSLSNLKQIIQSDSHIALKPSVATDDFQAIYNCLRDYLCNTSPCTQFSI